jgi:hypothetical protein
MKFSSVYKLSILAPGALQASCAVVAKYRQLQVNGREMPSPLRFLEKPGELYRAGITHTCVTVTVTGDAGCQEQRTKAVIT